MDGCCILYILLQSQIQTLSFPLSQTVEVKWQAKPQSDIQPRPETLR